MAVLEVMTREEGDLQVTWDTDNEQETRVARDTFERMQGKGYSAFRTSQSGARGEQIREFDPDAENIVMAPQMVGG